MSDPHTSVTKLKFIQKILQDLNFFNTYLSSFSSCFFIIMYKQLKLTYTVKVIIVCRPFRFVHNAAVFNVSLLCD